MTRISACPTPYPGLPSDNPDTAAAEELGFTPEQRERVRKIVSSHWTSFIALQEEEQKLPLGDEKARKAIGEKHRQEMASLRKQIEAALTREQWALCKEMAFQNLAVANLLRAARMAQPYDDVGLTKQQKTALQEIDAEYGDTPERIYHELTDKALTAFTPAQQQESARKSIGAGGKSVQPWLDHFKALPPRASPTPAPVYRWALVAIQSAL